MAVDGSEWKWMIGKDQPSKKNIIMAAFRTDGDDDHILHVSQ